MAHKLSNKLQHYLGEAGNIALARDQHMIEPAHVLAAMAADRNSALAVIAVRAGAELTLIADGLDKMIVNLPRVTEGHDGDMLPSRDLQRTLNLAAKETVKAGETHIASDTYALICAEHVKQVGDIFKSAGLGFADLAKVRERLRSGPAAGKTGDDERGGTIERYTVNLTALAREGKLDPVIGRDEEMRRTMQILQRRTKNNPVLIGEPGVGKTAIVEHLAQRVAVGEVPEGLKNRSVLALDLAGLLAGAKYRGEFEQRLKSLLKEIASAPDSCVLFIDELHTLIGAGASEGAVDAANMLKPALARGELRCIGATTLEEYRKHIERDAALERRFQRLLVQEPDNTASVAMLRGLRDKYELHHNVRITDPAIVAAVELSARYVTDRFLPDKAIDLVDEAAARLRIEADSKPEQIDILDRQISQLRIEEAAVRREKDAASQKRLAGIAGQIEQKSGQLGELSEQWRTEQLHREAVMQIREERDRLNLELEHLTRAGENEKAAKVKYNLLPELDKRSEKLGSGPESPLLKAEIGEQEIAEVVAKSTGVPVARLLGSERKRLLGIKTSLRSRVVGQDEAIEALAAAVQRSRTGLSDPDRPSGSFLFLGPTGVGKTELAKAVAEFLFDSERHLVRIDMSEYSEKHSVARLVGAPPGYVGYEDGGQLTEAVRRKPYSVVLFDEIEKAHPEAVTILLQTLDEGRLTDSRGRTVDFRNTVLVMTSNLGSAHLADGVGDDARAAVLADVRAFFRPEFLNRLDEIIVFNSLGSAQAERIAGMLLDRLAQRLQREKITLDFDAGAARLLAQKGFDTVYGARPLRRAIQSAVETPLAQALLNGECGPGQLISVRASGSDIVLGYEKRN